MNPSTSAESGHPPVGTRPHGPAVVAPARSVAVRRLLARGEARQTWLARWRSPLVGIVAVVTSLVLLRFVGRIYPLAHWLLWDLLRLWAWQAVLALSFVSAGYVVLARVLRVRSEWDLHTVALAVPLGAMVFASGMFVGGFLRLYGPVFAVILPALLCAAGARDLRPLGGALVRWWSAARPPLSPTAMAATAFGLLATALLYLGILSPDSIGYDASWFHVVTAQDYAREGRIVPFLASWPKNLPHLGSIFNTWSFLVPGLEEPALRWMMCQHTEVAFFLWTLLGVGAGIRWMAGRSVRGAWAVLFLFPGMFVPDSELAASADHFLAFFAVPVCVAILETSRTLLRRWWVLCAVLASGAIMTKFQAAYLLVPGAVVLAIAYARGAWRTARRCPDALSLKNLVAGPALALATLVVLTAPHFLKNWIYYGNPVYPLAQRVFTGSHPSFPGTPLLVDNILSHWGMKPPADFLERLWTSLRLAVTFPLHGRQEGAGYTPSFGALLTCTLPLVALLGRARRIQLGALICLGALFMWAWTYRQERNLQTILPALAVVAGATLVRAWELGRVARFGVAMLVAVQVAWNGDAYFSAFERVQSAVALIRSGQDGHAAERFAGYRRPFVEVGRALPKDALVLLHLEHLNLGMDRATLQDAFGFQGLVDYRSFHTAREYYDRLRALHVTHLVYLRNIHRAPSKQEEIVFAAFLARSGQQQREVSGMYILPLPADPPPVEPPYKVLVMGAGMPDGLYDIASLGTWDAMPPELQVRGAPQVALTAETSVTALAAQAQAVWLGNGGPVRAEDGAAIDRDFVPVVQFPEFTVKIRSR